jgi:hypothetical protein
MVIAFLTFRPALLHKLDPQQAAWPSPRSWVMASELLKAELDPAPAIGQATAAELKAFMALYGQIPDLEAILDGRGAEIPFPEEPSLRYAVTIGLTTRATEAATAYHAFRWLAQVAGPEWVQLCAVDLFRLLRSRGQMQEFGQLIADDEVVQQFLADYQTLLEW